uniref:Syndecan n=1 Tax=Alona affinis TaxID=381656 RepID=A0A9N6ZGA4_9CRUS|nr:EOG090X0QLW [Alona affinis]
MNLRIHVLAALLCVVVCLASVDSSIDNNSPASKQVAGSLKQKALDDLYIDDEDDDIQLRDEASGSGPLKPTRVEDDEDEEEEEEEEEEEDDEEDVVSSPVEKAKDVVPAAATPVGSSSSSSSSSADYKEDDVVAPPKVSPVAAPPSYPAPKPSIDDDDDEDDDDFEVQGSGDGGSGAGRSSSSSNTDDEDEDDYDDSNVDEDIEGIDINSVITEPVPKGPAGGSSKPDRKQPEVVVVAPPTTPSKTPKESGVAPVTPPPSSSTPQPTQPPPPPAVVETVSSTSAPSEPGNNDVHILDHKPEDRQASFFAQPGILAAVIGGAVVGLLCAILLVMFIVYRMRKKDEGSYVLDEPKRTSPNSHPYNKNSREFYA